MCLDGEKNDRVAFQARADYQNHAIGWLHRGYSSLGGGKVVRFPRIWMAYGECRLNGYLRPHGGVSQCLLCGSKEGLGVGGQLVAPVPINMKGHAVGSQTYPLVTLTCRACHHVSFVNVVDII